MHAGACVAEPSEETSLTGGSLTTSSSPACAAAHGGADGYTKNTTAEANESTIMLVAKR